MSPNEGEKKPAILLTGGSGFLGTAIVSELLDPDSPLHPSRIRILDVVPYTGVTDDRIELTLGDIRNPETVLRACSDMDMVIHTAAIVDWGTKPESEIMDVNVGGTENLLKAALSCNIRYFVYTSSLDAIFGGHSLVDIDETIPYPPVHPNSYCRSKCESEKRVIAANGERMKTCILRPADIYGEGDPFHVGSLIAMAKSGFYVRLGNGLSKSQHVYVRNMAWAHVLAAHALMNGNQSIPGNCYFITDGPPANFFHFFDRIVEASGYPIRPKNFWIPRGIAYIMGSVSEGIAWLCRPVKKYTPKFSRFAVIYTCSNFTFSAGKAIRDFQFRPKYSAEEAFRKTVGYFKR